MSLTNTNLIGCTATDVRTVIRPGECQLLIDPNGANRYFQIEFYDGLQAAVNLFSDPMCSIETTTYVFNQSSCNFGFTWNYDMCYNIDGTEECALQKAFQGPVIRTRYVPTLKADCGDKAPVCLDQGDLVCMDQCVAYETDGDDIIPQESDSYLMIVESCYQRPAQTNPIVPRASAEISQALDHGIENLN